jgi:hypothetical protein
VACKVEKLQHDFELADLQRLASCGTRTTQHPILTDLRRDTILIYEHQSLTTHSKQLKSDAAMNEYPVSVPLGTP